MSQFSEVTQLVVPLDERETSRRAVPVAGRLGRRLNLPIQLFQRVEHDANAAEAAATLEQIAAEYLPGIDATTRIVLGDDPIDAIVSTTGETGLLCMGTAASVRFHQGHFGSVAEGVARTLGRPMFLVGPEMDTEVGESTRKVVVAVDGSTLSEAALDVAADLAVAFDVPLWIVTVFSPKLEAQAQRQFGSGAATGESNYVHNLARRVHQSHGIDAEYEVLHHEHPADAIVDFVDNDGTVVMTTHGRSGLSRLVAGSVTTGVVAKSKRAVVVFRPTDAG